MALCHNARKGEGADNSNQYNSLQRQENDCKNIKYQYVVEDTLMLITIKPKKKLKNNSTIHRPAPPPLIYDVVILVLHYTKNINMTKFN